jgi:hypothetical protein
MLAPPARAARPATHHQRRPHAVELALRSQFGNGFRQFGAMRRRRNELEYPSGPGETTSPKEANETIEHAQRLYDAASRLLPRSGSSEQPRP